MELKNNMSFNIINLYRWYYNKSLCDDINYKIFYLVRYKRTVHYSS